MLIYKHYLGPSYDFASELRKALRPLQDAL